MLHEILYYRNEPVYLNKNFPYGPQNSILFSQFWAFSPFYTPDSCENHQFRVFLAEFSESGDQNHIIFGCYWENIDY
jgi:hypothetical protein